MRLASSQRFFLNNGSFNGLACAARSMRFASLLCLAAFAFSTQSRAGILEVPSATAPSLSAATEALAAPVESGPRVENIRIEGAERLEPETVKSYLTLAKGDVVNQDKLNASLKALYATGLFADAGLSMQDGTLVVLVAENPIVNRVMFEGNDALSKEDLEKEVQLKSRLVYTLPRVQKDTQRILDLYRRSGRFGAVVEPKIEQLEQNRVNVIFEITEGARTGVRSVTFIGNEHYSEGDLREIINTRESAWWRFLSTSDFYDPDRMNYDRDLLRRFYLNEGYVDFRLVSSVAELTPDRDNFFLTFTIEEGARYKLGKVSIQSDIKGMDTDTLASDLFTKEGAWYSVDAVEKTVAKLTATMGDRQYAFVEITPDVTRHKETQTVDLTYRIKEGARVYIGRIDITGNQRTLDKVIRRELQLAEGDPFSTTKMRRSEQQIRDLGFFESAKITPVDGAQPDRANLKVEVKEKSTGEISVGAGFSTTDGPLGDFNIRERNFLGKGQDVRVGATVASTAKTFYFSFTEPYFLDRDLNAGVDLFHVINDYSTQANQSHTDTGFTLRMGYPLSEELRQRVSYTLKRTELNYGSSISPDPLNPLHSQSLLSMFGQQLAYDTRDSKLDPTAGFIAHLDTDIAGAGGDRKFGRVQIGISQYVSLADLYILRLTGEAGYVAGLGQNVNVSDRFYMGGDDVRGFQNMGVGPRSFDGNGNTYARGGNRSSRGTIELTTPMPVPKEFGFKGHVFSDAGLLDMNDDTASASTLKKDETPRLSAGVGVSWHSPFGPLRLDVVEPLLKQKYDKVERIHFSFGTRF